MRILIPALMLLALPGCVASAIVGTTAAVVAAPFKVAGAAVDAATTSQEEADRNRGRELSKQEEAERKAAEKAEKQARKAEKERLKAEREAAEAARAD